MRTIWIWALLLYIVTIAFQGYGFGCSDQIELLPVIKFWLSDNSLYPHDFYIQFFAGKSLTERSPFLLLLYYTTGIDPLFIFLLHALTSILMFAGILKLSSVISDSIFPGVLTTLLLISVLSYISLGGNELFYNYLIPSLPAKTLAVWSLVFWIEHRPYIPYLLLGIATYFQPLVGLQLFLILSIVQILVRSNGYSFVKDVLIYSLIAGPWIISLLIAQSDDHLPLNLYFEIIEFRVAHHFFPGYFHWWDYLVLAFLLLPALILYGKEHKRLQYFSAIAILGCLIYTLGVELMKWELALNTQWFKVTIWIELLGMLAITVWIREYLQLGNKFMTFASLTLLASLVMVVISGFKSPTYNAPFISPDTAEKEVARWIRDHSDVDDIILYPPNFSCFKMFSERSGYIDFKAMIHHHDYMKEYYERIIQAYQINIDDRRELGLQNMLNKGERHLLDLDHEALGIDYLIIPSHYDLGRQSIFSTQAQPELSVYPISH
ncbi:MAG: DUF6798 domain-containing protein [Saprospiraceae bacterium]|nr:DUF6798 domain-containing protein [Saprospiraceae bacterium]